ncbi:MAG TPA: Gfo/Idh/MocA family oxidoreductase [Thermoanaerobaculia bacterium]|jgi:predicted dehydrogenase
MTATGPVRLAVVGVGHLGRHHARVAASLPGACVVGVHDHHEGRADAVARERGLRVLSSTEEVAEKADAVIIATPTSSHAELVRFFLDRDVDVLVEKPITTTVAEADAVVELARARGRVLQVGHVERYNPAVQAALSAVDAPRFIEGHRLGVFAPRSLDVDVVLDLMIHDLQIVAELVQRPVREIRAAGIPVLTARLDIANARIAFEGGCVANLTASRVSAARMRKLRIFAPKVYLSVDMMEQKVDAFRLSRETDRAMIVPSRIPVDGGEPLAREVADFVGAVRDRREPLVPGERGREALALAQRVLVAIEEHRRGVEEGRV